MIFTDNIYVQGKGHKVCQDYSLSTKIENRDIDLIIVSDGCSSSLNTDIGSRIICHNIKRSFEHSELKDSKDMIIPILENSLLSSRFVAKYMGLNNTCLDSTILLLYNIKDYTALVVCGDGFCIANYKSGKSKILKFEYTPSNLPFYLNYNNSERLEYFFKESKNLEISETIFADDEFIERPENKKILQKENSTLYTKLFNRDELQSIILSSDGMSTFNNNIESLDIKEVYKHLIKFKNYKGEFLKRRVNSMKKELAKQGYYHFDDLGLAAIYFE